MSEAPRVVRHGSVGGTPINVDMARIEHGNAIKVRLTSAYTIEHPPGLPSRPSMTGCAAANLDFPRTIAAGTILSLFAGEAAALVAAGAAAYV